MSETTTEECQLLAERVRQAIESADFIYEGKKVHVTVSVGLATYKGTSVPKLIEQADQALYQAKANGRNQVVIFSHHY